VAVLSANQFTLPQTTDSQLREIGATGLGDWQLETIKRYDLVDIAQSPNLASHFNNLHGLLQSTNWMTNVPQERQRYHELPQLNASIVDALLWLMITWLSSIEVRMLTCCFAHRFRRRHSSPASQ
jgi:hypothetical protein